MRTVYDIIEDYKEELSDLLESKTVIDPALFWAGKMSRLVHSVYILPIANIGNTVELLHKVSEEYDNVIFKRAK